MFYTDAKFLETYIVLHNCQWSKAVFKQLTGTCRMTNSYRTFLGRSKYDKFVKANDALITLDKSPFEISQGNQIEFPSLSPNFWDIEKKPRKRPKLWLVTNFNSAWVVRSLRVLLLSTDFILILVTRLMRFCFLNNELHVKIGWSMTRENGSKLQPLLLERVLMSNMRAISRTWLCITAWKLWIGTDRQTPPVSNMAFVSN